MLNKCQQNQLPDSGKLSKFTKTNGWEIKGISTCPSQERRNSSIHYITVTEMIQLLHCWIYNVKLQNSLMKWGLGYVMLLLLHYQLFNFPIPHNNTTWITWITKSLPLKSAIVLGSLVLPHTKRRKRDRSVLEKDSITSQNHWIKEAVGSMPLYVATDFRRWSGISGLPHTWKIKYSYRRHKSDQVNYSWFVPSLPLKYLINFYTDKLSIQMFEMPCTVS